MKMGSMGAAAPTDYTAQLTQIYNTYLHRAPDAAGMAYWQGDLNAGVPLSAVISSIQGSAEYAATNAAIAALNAAGAAYSSYTPATLYSANQALTTAKSTLTTSPGDVTAQGYIAQAQSILDALAANAAKVAQAPAATVAATATPTASMQSPPLTTGSATLSPASTQSAALTTTSGTPTQAMSTGTTTDYVSTPVAAPVSGLGGMSPMMLGIAAVAAVLLLSKRGS